MDQGQRGQPPLLGVPVDDDDLPIALVVVPDDDDDDDDDDVPMMIRREGQGGRRNNNNNHNDIDDDDELFVDAQLLHPHHHPHHRNHNHNIGTSFLYGMIQDRSNTICSSVLLLGGGGGGRDNDNNDNNTSTNDGTCRSIVRRINEFNDDVYYQDTRTGRTPLHEACLNCSCLHVISSILHVNPLRATVVDNNGNTPLHLLCIGISTHDLGSITMGEILDLLLDNNNNNNSTAPAQPPRPNNAATTMATTAAATTASVCNRQGNSPLHMACMAPESMVHYSFFQKLLTANYGASAARLNNMNQTPLNLHCQRRQASARVAKLLIDCFPEAIQIMDGNGKSPIHYASLHCNVELIDILLRTNAGAAAALRTTTTLETPLHLLCKKNSASAASSMVNNEIVERQVLPALELLLDANANAAMAKDATKSITPLHLVCKNPRLPLTVLKTILQACPQSASTTDNNNYLPLHYATECGCSTEIIEFLIKTYPRGVYALTKKMDTPLSLASACNKSAKTVALLIQANHKALRERNHYGFVPLHCVCGAVQPRIGIVEEILNACPQSVTIKSNNGDTAFHVASGNPSACVGVIELLTSQYKKNFTAGVVGGAEGAAAAAAEEAGATTTPNTNLLANKTENTPLHHACFRGSPFEHIETLAMSNPQWVKCCNNAGYTALQILSKNGRLQDREIELFSRLGGPGVFAKTDMMGNTPLHSAMREETDIEALRCLIRAYPDALNMKTTYGDTPLHLACFRRVQAEMVREVALAGSAESRQLLTPNMAGQTPIGIASDEFEAVCKRGCCVKGQYRPEQQRAFDVLATLVKILHYSSSQNDDGDRTGSLLRASLSLHRRDVRLDPAFIRRVLHLYPEEARILDDDGNYPIHIECSIPVEKMSLLNSTPETSCTGSCHKRQNILRILFDIFPDACKARNKAGEFPLGLMIKARGGWDRTFCLILRHFPQALHWSQVNNKVFPRILEKVSRECGVATLHMLITSRPDLAMKCLKEDEL